MKKRKRINRKRQYVIPVGNGWAVKSEGNEKFTIITDTKREAVSVAKDIAKRYGSELVVYDKNGEIVESNNYAKKALSQEV